MLESVVDEAVAMYKEKMLTKVEALKGKDDQFSCEVKVDKKNFLPEWNAERVDEGCLGGFKMYARKNRIVCSQTLEDRLALVYGLAIP